MGTCAPSRIELRLVHGVSLREGYGVCTWVLSLWLDLECFLIRYTIIPLSIHEYYGMSSPSELLTCVIYDQLGVVEIKVKRRDTHDIVQPKSRPTPANGLNATRVQIPCTFNVKASCLPRIPRFLFVPHSTRPRPISFVSVETFRLFWFFLYKSILYGVTSACFDGSTLSSFLAHRLFVNTRAPHDARDRDVAIGA